MSVPHNRWQSLPERFWANVPDLDPSVCWDWQGGIGNHGYGSIWGEGKRWTASRLMWTLRYGEIPAGLCVCHRCDNRKCVNPAHLFLGTIADNQRDMQRKGRGSGPKTPIPLAVKRSHRGTKLSEEIAASIRESSETGAELARRYGVSQAAVSMIRSRRTWWPPVEEGVAA